MADTTVNRDAGATAKASWAGRRFTKNRKGEPRIVSEPASLIDTGIFQAWHKFGGLDLKSMKQLRLACKALRNNVDLSVEHLEVTQHQATEEAMRAASMCWKHVKSLDVHVRDQNTLTKASLKEMFVEVKQIRLHVFKLKETVDIKRCSHLIECFVSSMVLCYTGVFYLSGTLSEENEAIKFADLQEGSQPRELNGHTSEVTCITMSPDGNTLASCSDDGSVRLWCPQTACCRRVIPRAHGAYNFGPDSPGESRSVYCIAFSPDGSSLTSGGTDKSLKQWSVAGSSTNPTSTCTGHETPMCVVYASATQIISGGSAELRVWDVDSGACTHVLGGHTQSLFGVYMSADGGVLISSSLDGTMKRWGLRQGTGRWECMLTLASNFGFPVSLASVAVSPGGDFAVSCAGDDYIRVWNLKTGACRMVLRAAHTSVASLALSKDGSTLLSGGFLIGGLGGLFGGTIVMKVWQLYE